MCRGAFSVMSGPSVFFQLISAMNKALSSYRPHDPGHDYYAPGVYLITIVVRNRECNHELLGSLNNNLKAPAVLLTEIGRAVMEEWEKHQPYRWRGAMILPS